MDGGFVEEDVSEKWVCSRVAGAGFPPLTDVNGVHIMTRREAGDGRAAGGGHPVHQ